MFIEAGQKLNAPDEDYKIKCLKALYQSIQEKVLEYDKIKLQATFIEAGKKPQWVYQTLRSKINELIEEKKYINFFSQVLFSIKVYRV